MATGILGSHPGLKKINNAINDSLFLLLSLHSPMFLTYRRMKNEIFLFLTLVVTGREHSLQSMSILGICKGNFLVY